MIGKSCKMMVLVAALLAAVTAGATEVARDQARIAVETWVRGATADAQPDARVERLEPQVRAGRTVGYVAHLSSGGFCLCGADDRLLPVYLYSPGVAYDASIPDYRDIFAEMETRLDRIEQAQRERAPELRLHEQALQERAASWQALAAGRVPARANSGARAEPDTMTLPVTSYWHQGSPYNDLCPVLTPGSDEHTVTGCVATALAQILYYWRWPQACGPGGALCALYEYRVGDLIAWDWVPLATNPGIAPGFEFGRLRWTASNGGQLGMLGYWDPTMYASAHGLSENEDYRAALSDLWDLRPQRIDFVGIDFSLESYDWSQIHDVHSDPPNGGNNGEVARLCYQAGLAVCMGYGIDASSASTSTVVTALPNYYGYAPATYYVFMNQNALTEEIQWLRPAQISGHSDAGGHSWVVCGYNKTTDPNRQFLMNMGWGGGSTNWYTLDQVFPNQQGFVGCIAPQNIVKFVGGGTDGDGSPLHPYGDVTEAAAEYPTGATIIFRAGSVNTFAPGGVTFNRACTLKGLNAVLQSE
jgi:hypothetical protein